MITGAGVVARKLTFSNKVSELLGLDGFCITSLSGAAGLSRRSTAIVRRSHRWHSQTNAKARDEPNTGNSDRYEAADGGGMFVDARSKMFRQHLKCSLTAKLHQDVQEQAPDFFFVSFYSASCLTLGVLVQRCLGQPFDLLARHDQRLWYLANCRLLFIFRSVERRVHRNLEGRVGERSLGWTDCRAATPTFFFF